MTTFEFRTLKADGDDPDVGATFAYGDDPDVGASKMGDDPDV